MRKGVIDGSDPSAFQRTMIVGLNGTIKVNGSSFEHTHNVLLRKSLAAYNQIQEAQQLTTLTGLGIPLIEIQTGP
jgi:Glu-tRNA(Gln) amidotransferase subunit E-like FAD-binding protein